MTLHPASVRPPADCVSSPQPDGTCEALSAIAVEQFWAEGTAAYPAAPASTSSKSPSCCAGIDTPGVGITHALECNQAGMPYVVGVVPLPLRTHVDRMDEAARDQRDVLLIRLMFAARAQAEAQIESALDENPAFCADCLEDECDGWIVHDSECRVGRVLSILDELQQLVVGTEGGAL